MPLFAERTGLPRWLSGKKKKKKLPANAGDPGSESGRSPGEGNGNLLQCSCLQKPMDREAQWAIVHEVAKTWTQLYTQHSFTHSLGGRL